MSTPVEDLRNESARHAVLLRYAAAHDRFSEAEQIHIAKGEIAEAEGAHAFAAWALRAYRLELDNPPPAGLATPYYYDPHDRGTP